MILDQFSAGYKMEDMKEAVLYEKLDGKKVSCFLCNYRCKIAEGKFGYCQVRQNIDGILYSRNYNRICAANCDPIEKKPLFHFQPGSQSFSIACIGCNFKCDFCQNWQISQAQIEDVFVQHPRVKPESVVDNAISNGCKSIAYTYTEPTIFMELCADCGRIAKEKGLKNIFVSNGYMTKEAIDFALDWLDGINIDLKSFSDDYYKRLCKARLQPVLDTISYIAKETDIWMEITTLIIPGENDSEEELKKLVGFIVENAGVDVPWHISRFYPQYKHNDSIATPAKALEKAYEIGAEAGLRYIYVGNLPGTGHENTFCYNCNSLLIERTGYTIISNSVKDGCCGECKSPIAGVEL